MGKREREREKREMVANVNSLWYVPIVVMDGQAENYRLPFLSLI